MEASSLPPTTLITLITTILLSFSRTSDGQPVTESILLHPQDLTNVALEPQRNYTPILCRCTAGFCFSDEDHTCISEGGACFSELEAEVDDDGVEVLYVRAAGCVSPGIELDSLCDAQDYKCCYKKLCNVRDYYTNEPLKIIGPTDATTAPKNSGKKNVTNIRPDRTFEDKTTNYTLYIVGVIIFLITLFLGGMLLVKFCWHGNPKALPNHSLLSPLALTLPLPTSTSSSSFRHSANVQKQLADITESCSSGSGIPRLMEKTLIREITFRERIGKGRYGEVWRGHWRAGGEVAIKVFSNREESSWWHEAEMYQNYWLRHENILSFIGADQRDCVADMQYYLVLNFHPRGSLYDFLQSCQLTTQETIKMLLSLTSGLDYLHTEIRSSVAKPRIAHRDLKSKNILVKNNGQCCIADFGLSVRSDHFDVLQNKKQFHFQVGTRRYMAPEILDSTIKLTSFENLKKVDMYMFGLVVWEIGQRVAPGASPYSYPFQHDVSCDPSIEEMTGVVVKHGLRPPLTAPSWNSCPEMLELGRIVSECWDGNPSVRLTSLRVKKDLMRLVTSLSKSRDSGCYYTDNSDQGFISWD